MLKVLNTFFLAIVGVLLAGDALLHPAFSINNFGLDARFLLMLFISLNVVFALLGKIYIPDWILKTNRKTFFLPLVVVAVLFVLSNYFFHKTYALSTFGVFADKFLLLPLMSGFLIYVDPRRTWLKSKLSKIIFYAPPLLFFGFVVFQHFFPDTFWIITQEDHIIEWVQFGFYVLASVFAFLAAEKLRQKNKTHAALFLFLSLFLFFIAAEEISWGQRILGIETPRALEHINWQDEISIHNIGVFQAKIYYFYMAVGAYGAFSYLLARKFFPTVFKKYKLIFPHPLFSFYFFAGLASYFYERFIYFYYELFTLERIAYDNPGKWKEVAELYLAAGFLFFAYFSYKKVISEKNSNQQLG